MISVYLYLFICAGCISRKFSPNAFKLVYVTLVYSRIFVLKIVDLGIMVRLQRDTKEFDIIRLTSGKFKKYIIHKFYGALI